MLTVFSVGLSLAACSSHPVVLNSHQVVSAAETATLSNRCDSVCHGMIKQHLKLSWPYQMSEGLLLEVNGQQGTRKVSRGMAYDSPLHGKFNITVPAGSTELLIDHNSQLIYGAPKRFNVNFVSGHDYVIGRIRVELRPRMLYGWFPIVYDATAKQIIYGNEDLISFGDAMND